MTKLKDSQKINRSHRIVGFAVLADHRVNLKESGKRDKYQYLARQLKTNATCYTNCNWFARNNTWMISK